MLPSNAFNILPLSCLQGNRARKLRKSESQILLQKGKGSVNHLSLLLLVSLAGRFPARYLHGLFLPRLQLLGQESPSQWGLPRSSCLRITTPIPPARTFYHPYKLYFFPLLLVSSNILYTLLIDFNHFAHFFAYGIYALQSWEIFAVIFPPTNNSWWNRAWHMVDSSVTQFIGEFTLPSQTLVVFHQHPFLRGQRWSKYFQWLNKM